MYQAPTPWGNTLMHARAAEICELTRSLEGVRYLRRGRDPEMGLDCAGVIAYPGHQLGLGDHDCIAYGDHPNQRQFFRELIKGGCFGVPMTELSPGDIIMIRVPKWPVHSAIYLGPNAKGVPEICHAWLPARKVCIVPYVNADLKFVFRYPGG